MSGTSVYVGGLNDSIKKEDLEREFEKYGKLNNVWVANNPPGFGFVEFETRDEADAACDNLNGTEILGSQLKVEISRGRGRGRGGGGRGFFPRGGRGDFGGRGGGGYRGRGGFTSRYDDYGSSRGGGGGGYGGYGGGRDNYGYGNSYRS